MFVSDCPPPMVSFGVHRLVLEDGWLHSTGGMASDTRVVEVNYYDNRNIVLDQLASQGQVTLTNQTEDRRNIKYRHTVQIPTGEYTVHYSGEAYEVCAQDGTITFFTLVPMDPATSTVVEWDYVVEIDRHGDLNNDGRVSGYDIGLFMGCWGTDLVEADFNLDGIVNAEDFGILLENWTGN